MKTLSFCSSSSARASFKASLTVYSLPAAWAYPLLLGRVHGTALRKDDRRGDEALDERRREDAGRNKRAAVMTAENRRRRPTKEGKRSTDKAKRPPSCREEIESCDCVGPIAFNFLSGVRAQLNAQRDATLHDWAIGPGLHVAAAHADRSRDQYDDLHLFTSRYRRSESWTPA
jgi:hypothetical protein